MCVKGTGSTTIAIDSRTDPGYVVSIALSPAHSVHAFERNLTHRLRRSTIRLYMHADFICDGWALKVLKVLLSIPTGKEACLLPVDCHGYKPVIDGVEIGLVVIKVVAWVVGRWYGLGRITSVTMVGSCNAKYVGHIRAKFSTVPQRCVLGTRTTRSRFG